MGTFLAALVLLIAVYLLYVFYRALKPEPLGEPPQMAAPSGEVAKEGLSSRSATEGQPLDVDEDQSSRQACPVQGEEVEEATEEELPDQLRDPETGETAAMPTSYHFAKRWIKEAMVKEGLLDRVYNQSELKDAEIARRTKEALEKFKRLKKYWP